MSRVELKDYIVKAIMNDHAVETKEFLFWFESFINYEGNEINYKVYSLDLERGIQVRVRHEVIKSEEEAMKVLMKLSASYTPSDEISYRVINFY